MENDSRAKRREFDLLMSSQGIEVPEDRRSGAFSAYLELRRMAKKMRQPREAESEPSNIFNLPSIIREG